MYTIFCIIWPLYNKNRICFILLVKCDKLGSDTELVFTVSFMYLCRRIRHVSIPLFSHITHTSTLVVVIITAMLREHASSVRLSGVFEPWSNHTEDHEIGICCFSAKNIIKERNVTCSVRVIAVFKKWESQLIKKNIFGIK